MEITEKIKDFFGKVIELVFGVLLVFIIFAIAVGTFQLFFSVWNLLRLEGIAGHYIEIISDILTLYVMVELFRSLVEYFESSRLRLTFILDAAIVFIIREILIGVFKHELKVEMIYAFSCMLFVLGALRIAAVLVSKYEYELHKRIKD